MSDPTLTLFYEFARKRTLVASIGPTLSISRTGNASRVNGAGFIEAVAANIARFDFDPATRRSLGLLVEEERRNIARQSGNLVSAPWTSIQSPAIATNDAISPRGILEATLLTDNNATNREGVQQSISVPNTTDTHVTSVFVRKTAGGASPTFGLEMVYADGVGTTPVQIRLNTDTGVTNGVGDGGVQDFGDWWRLWGLSTNNFSGNRTLLVKVLPALAAHGSFVDVMSTTGSAHVWGFQSEVGSTPTSYIETFGAVVIRNGDNITSTDMSWLNTQEGTLFTETIVPKIPESGTGTPFIIALDNGGSSSRILHTYDREPGILRTFLFVNATNLNDVGIALAEGDNLLMVSSWNNATATFTVISNGRPELTNTSRSTPQGLTTLRIGISDTNVGQHNGHMRSLRYYNVNKPTQFRSDLGNGLISENNDLTFTRNLARPLERPLVNTMR